jgi:ribonuclease P protein component
MPEAAGMKARMSDCRFPKQLRLLRGGQFEKVYRRRRSAADRLLLVHACENGLDHCRLGLSVSRRVGGAVVRNRWKRLLREAFRQARGELPEGLDLVVSPRRGTTIEPDFAGVRRSLVGLARQADRRIKRDSR